MTRRPKTWDPRLGPAQRNVLLFVHRASRLGMTPEQLATRMREKVAVARNRLDRLAEAGCLRKRHVASRQGDVFYLRSWTTDRTRRGPAARAESGSAAPARVPPAAAQPEVAKSERGPKAPAPWQAPFAIRPLPWQEELEEVSAAATVVWARLLYERSGCLAVSHLIATEPSLRTVGLAEGLASLRSLGIANLAQEPGHGWVVRLSETIPARWSAIPRSRIWSAARLHGLVHVARDAKRRIREKPGFLPSA